MVEYKYSGLYLQDSKDKQLRIEFDTGTITNTELHSENFELLESICSDDQLRFGCCEVSSVAFRISNSVTALKDKELTVTETLDGRTDVSFVIGQYKVHSDKLTADRRYRDITAYDAMYDIINAEVSDWYNGLLPNADSTVTLKEFRDSFLGYFGIEQEEVELINDTMTVSKTIEPSKLSGKTVITTICEINGCFGHIGRDGQFKYVFLRDLDLYPADTLYPAEDVYPGIPGDAEEISGSYYISAKYEDYETAVIDKLQIRQEEDDVGYIFGDGSNCYVVQDNFLVYGKSADELQVIAKNLYAIISNVWYRPAHVEAKGNPCLEVGDGIKLETSHGTIYTYILQRTLKGIHALKDTYDAEGEQYQSEQVNSVRESIIQLKGKTNKLTRTVDETRSYIADVEKELSSEISQNANEIALRVKKGEVISEINISPEKITISADRIDLVGIVNADAFISNLIEAEKLNAKFATLNKLSTVDAEIRNLISENIKVINGEIQNLDTKKLSTSQFTAETISAMNITVQSANVKGILSVGQLDINGIVSAMSTVSLTVFDLQVGGVLRYQGKYITTQTINGVTYLVVGDAPSA